MGLNCPLLDLSCEGDPSHPWGRLLLVSLTLFYEAGLAQADAGGQTAPTQVVVLDNGHTLSGVVAARGDSYEVTLADHSKVYVRRDRTLMIADDLDAAYRRRAADLAGLSPTDLADAHIDLARWCLRLDMPGRAEDQLLYAEVAGAQRSDIEPVRRQISLLRRQANDGSRHYTPQRDLSDLSLAKPNGSITDRLPTRDLTDGVPPFDDWPRIARRQFARQIQPLLVSRCGMGGCHGPGGVAPRLARRNGPGVSNAMATRDNLAAIMPFLVADAGSGLPPLLEMAARPHGGRAASESTWSSRYQQTLQEWFALLADATPDDELDMERTGGGDSGRDRRSVQCRSVRSSLIQPGARDGVAQTTKRPSFDRSHLDSREPELARTPGGEKLLVCGEEIGPLHQLGRCQPIDLCDFCRVRAWSVVIDNSRLPPHRVPRAAV